MQDWTEPAATGVTCKYPHPNILMIQRPGRGFYRWLLCRSGHELFVCGGLWRDGRVGSKSGVGPATSSTGQMVKANPQFTSTTPQNVAKLSLSCVTFRRAHPYALIPSIGLPSGVRALKGVGDQATVF